MRFVLLGAYGVVLRCRHKVTETNIDILVASPNQTYDVQMMKVNQCDDCCTQRARKGPP